ncbi:NADPH-dependent FMN reductase [Streptomyces sp. NPDC048603]|uniref:NADPH-dependent FMN reductase n=1 Tax=Streptomyces sp. NPDC048603 TaxID=3365577 RepID=UPI00371D9476
MNLVAFSGSLRSASLNTGVVRTVAELGPALGVTTTVYPDLGRLPYFDQDRESSGPPVEVLEFRALLAGADAVLISSPEYAHGTSGVLKNALEWVVGGGELVDKPLAVVTASPSMTGGDRAQAWLSETLAVMGARVIPESLPIPLASAKIKDGRVTDPVTLDALRGVVEALRKSAAETGTVPWT